MMKKRQIGEIVYQLILHTILFVFYAFDKENMSCSEHHLAFFFNYISAAFVINYFIVPFYLYPKKYIKFTCLILGLLTMVILIEELFLEQIYFPGTIRAKVFNSIFYCLLDVLPIITILVGFKFAWDAYWNQKKIEQMSKLMEESELQFLKTQINPHFLFNNLNNIYALAVEQSPQTPDIILELSSVLRYVLYESKGNEVLVAKDIKHLKDYTKLNTYQFDERGVVNFEDNGNYGPTVIAPHLLIMFVENAFKHSSSSVLNNVFIDINIELNSENELLFRCKNSFEQQSNIDHLSEGIGLNNVKKRLQLLYPNRYELDIKTENSIYDVFLKIKLKELK